MPEPVCPSTCPFPPLPSFSLPPSKSFPGPQGKIKGREEKRKKVACGTPFEPKRPNPHGYLATSLAVTCPRLGASYGLWDTLRTQINKSACDTLFCASQNASREGLAASCRAAIYADWHVAFAAQGLVHVAHPLKQKEQIRMGILQHVCLRDLTLRFAECFQRGSGSVL